MCPGWNGLCFHHLSAHERNNLLYSSLCAVCLYLPDSCRRSPPAVGVFVQRMVVLATRHLRSKFKVTIDLQVIRVCFHNGALTHSKLKNTLPSSSMLYSVFLPIFSLSGCLRLFLVSNFEQSLLFPKYYHSWFKNCKENTNPKNTHISLCKEFWILSASFFRTNSSKLFHHVTCSITHINLSQP